ncbi:MAG: response regulator [Calditrichaeota bacterium]|nr:MAG: response regulator [Calditrichota bacterium]
MSILKSAKHQVFLSIVLLCGLIVGGTTGYALLEDYSIADGFYMTIITITTVGYGEIKPLSTSGRLFTSVLILFGFAAIAFVGRTFAESFFDRIMSSNSEKKKMLNEIAQLESHYIICGYGRVGNAVAEKLRSFGNKFVIIDSDPESCKQLEEDNCLFLEGNATNDRTLLMAGIKKAVGLLAILPSVADSLFITLTARELNPSLQIIARVDSATSEKRLIQAGADIVISPYTSAGHGIVNMMLAATGKVEIKNQPEQIIHAIPRWITLNNEPDLRGATLQEFSEKKGFKVLGLRRSGEDLLDPQTEIKLITGDQLYIVEQGKLAPTEKIQRRKNTPIVLIVDDNPVILKLYVRLFRRSGFTPITAKNGDEALKMITENKPNAAVIDYQLGGFSGIDICNKVRNEQKNNEIKLILYTADDSKKIRDKAINFGADAVVVKSNDSSELIELVIGLLRKK